MESIAKDYSSGCSGDYSCLETAVENSADYVLVANGDDFRLIPASGYVSGMGYNKKETKGYGNCDNYFSSKRETYITPTSFLKEIRPLTQFIGNASEIRHYIEQIFELTTGQKFPQDLVIEVLPKEQFMESHIKSGGIWSEGIQGFCINRINDGISTIICKENHLDELLLTIGHEIGHVLSVKLNDKINEEAKAFAFELAWIETIYEHDIAGLKNSIKFDLTPAENGLHNKAFAFVKKLIKEGKKAIDVFFGLVEGVFGNNQL